MRLGTDQQRKIDVKTIVAIEGSAVGRLNRARALGAPYPVEPESPRWARWSRTGPMQIDTDLITRATEGRGLYLDSEPESFLRWYWCDQGPVDRAIDHEGWYSNDAMDEKIRGVVFRLTRGRGFLAGWSMGEGMASYFETYPHDDEYSACLIADGMAEQAAERQMEFEREESERLDCEHIIWSLDRARVVELLEGIGIACYDDESTNDLRECLMEDAFEGATYTREDIKMWGSE